MQRDDDDRTEVPDEEYEAYVAGLDKTSTDDAGERTKTLLNVEAGYLRDAVRVEDWLMDVGAGYEEHVARLRADKIKQELLDLKDRPSITQHAKKLTRGGIPVEDRLMNVHFSKQKKLEQLGKQERDKVDPECTYRPMINTASKGKTSKYMFQGNKEQRLEEMRRRRVDDEVNELRANPSIDEKSRKIAANRTGGMSVEDYLLFTDKQHKHEMFERHERESLKGLQSQPSITQKAASLTRPGDVGTRLFEQRLGSYRDAAALVQNPANLSVASRREKAMAAAMMHRGEVESFQPSINPHHQPAGQSPTARGRVDEKLYQQHKERNSARRQAELQREEEIVANANRRHMSKQSELIYEERDLDKDAYERLYEEKPRRSTSSDDGSLQKRITTNNFLVRLAEWDAMQAEKRNDVERKRHEKMRREMSECTFDPFKSPTLRRSRSNTRSSRAPIIEGTLADRSTTWISRRDSRLAQQKQEKRNAELDGCTFVPYINQETPDMSTASNNAYGYNEFVTRLRSARKDKEEHAQRKESVFTKGDKWSGATTVPKEFNLSQSNSRSRSTGKERSYFSYEHGHTAQPVHELFTRRGEGVTKEVPPRPFAFPPSWIEGHDDSGSADVSDFLASQHASVLATINRHR